MSCINWKLKWDFPKKFTWKNSCFSRSQLVFDQYPGAALHQTNAANLMLKTVKNNHDHTPSVHHENKLKFHTYIFFVYSTYSPVNRRPERAKRPTTIHLLPTHTKLIMSDSSVLIWCANFISKLHRLEETLLWQNGWTAWSSTPTWFYCQRAAVLCVHWNVDAHVHNPTDRCRDEHNVSVHMGCFNRS